MARVHVFSVKAGTSHGLWQYKSSGSHERVILHGLQQVLDTTCRLLGYDCRDRSAVYLLHFAAEPFEGCQVIMEKIRERPDGGCHYRAARSRMGSFRARGFFPGLVRDSYLHAWPDKLYLRLEKSLSGGIVD